MAFRPHHFGRYTIIDPVAVGGMAEIYRARVTGAKDGPDRIIIIKKVIANLSQNSEFIQMFEEEIKITVGFTHPNIIQIYDYGQVDEQHFLAMEYVEGKNLRQFVKRLSEMKSMFSIDMSCHIISQICHALAYAHNFKDRLSGKHLQIVHRDISPQNIMLSYEGAVKLFDFGIAKAKSASEATRAGVIKGKPSYLSPEQINGEELDGRSDIFALGIVLWELLTAKRLFVAENDMGVLKLIQSAKIEPPSTFNPAVPQALDAIILKSLARDRTKRYQGAEEFQRDLHRFLYSFNPAFNPADLSYYAQELFKKEIVEDRERLMKYLGMEPEAVEPPADTNKPAKKKKKEDDSKLAEGLVSSLDFSRDAMENMLSSNTSTPDLSLESSSIELAGVSISPTKKEGTAGKPATPFVSRSSLPPSIAGKKPGSDQMVIPPWQKSGSAQASGTGSRKTLGTRTSLALEKSMSQSNTKSRNTLAMVGIGALVIFLVAQQTGILVGTPLEFLAGESTPTKSTKRNIASESDSAPVASPVPVATTSNTAAPATVVGTVILQTNVDSYQVSVNGVPSTVTNNQFSAPIGAALSVRVSKSGYQPIAFQIQLGDAKPVAYKIELKSLPSGVIYFNTVPDAKLTFYHEAGLDPIVLNTPVRNYSLPAGRYKIHIENSLMNYNSDVEVVIQEGKMTRVEKSLQ